MDPTRTALTLATVLTLACGGKDDGASSGDGTDSSGSGTTADSQGSTSGETSEGTGCGAICSGGSGSGGSSSGTSAGTGGGSTGGGATDCSPSQDCAGAGSLGGPKCGDGCCAAGEWCDQSGIAPVCKCGNGPACDSLAGTICCQSDPSNPSSCGGSCQIDCV